jgi:hypothetical protein
MTVPVLTLTVLIVVFGAAVAWAMTDPPESRAGR